jgi:lipoprotein-anchoring transpeptidase ErfK/SrfK
MVRRRGIPACGRGVFGFPCRAAAIFVTALIVGAATSSLADASKAPAATSIVAQGAGSRIAVFRSPTAKRPSWVFRNPRAGGSPVVFLVLQRVPGWVQVRLAVRPDGSVGWVRARSVKLALDPYRVAVSLRGHRITVQLRGRTMIVAPVAVGRPALPTPTGHYYLVELLRQADPNGVYGPYAFGLSAYSHVLFTFGGGPGQIGLHGTDEPWLLGTSVSHGCVRMANALIVRLAHILPLGTPVEIDS